MTEYIKLRMEDYKKLVIAAQDNLPKGFFKQAANYISTSDES